MLPITAKELIALQEFVTIPTYLIEELKNKPYSKLGAYIDILNMADENGEFYSTTRKLMSRWGWGSEKTTSFIKKLEERNTIRTQTEHKRNTLYRINIEFIKCMQDTIRTQTEHKRNTNKTQYEEVCERVIEYFNSVCNTNYKNDTEDNKREIRARLNERYKEEDFYIVIDKKAKEWLGTQQEKYLRPSTLFGRKFGEYLNQNIVTNKPKNNFNIFPQGKYDFKELENSILSN